MLRPVEIIDHHDAHVNEEDIYPHALRATAATEMALYDISAAALSSIMGWSDISTARAYIRASDENAAKEVRAKLP